MKAPVNERVMIDMGDGPVTITLPTMLEPDRVKKVIEQRRAYWISRCNNTYDESQWRFCDGRVAQCHELLQLLGLSNNPDPTAAADCLHTESFADGHTRLCFTCGQKVRMECPHCHRMIIVLPEGKLWHHGGRLTRTGTGERPGQQCRGSLMWVIGPNAKTARETPTKPCGVCIYCVANQEQDCTSRPLLGKMRG